MTLKAVRWVAFWTAAAAGIYLFTDSWSPLERLWLVAAVLLLPPEPTATVSYWFHRWRCDRGYRLR